MVLSTRPGSVHLEVGGLAMQAQGENQDCWATGGARPRILWADDHPEMRATVRRLLGERYEVEAVADGEAALAAAHARPPNLVLSDVIMPRLDGVGLLDALRADPATRAIPIILMSGGAGEETRVEGFEAGADDYLVKPFTARELLARVALTSKWSASATRRRRRSARVKNGSATISTWDWSAWRSPHPPRAVWRSTTRSAGSSVTRARSCSRRRGPK